MLLAASLAAGLLVASRALAAGPDPFRPGLYEVVTQIALPNVETGLRHATRSERRCLREADLPALFPVLAEPGLRHCRLVPEGERNAEQRFTLRCDGDAVTSGAALWQVAPARVFGTLELRLGGKNMTLSERVSATRVGECR